MYNLNTIITNIELLTTTNNYSVREDRLIRKRCSCCIKLCNLFSYFSKTWNLRVQNQEARELFAKTTFINTQIRLINSWELESLEECSMRIKNLFFKILPLHPYNRDLITRGGNLERILNTKEVLRREEDCIDPVSGKHIGLTLAEAHFSLNLGVKPEVVKPSSPYYYILNRDGERLGVFKRSLKMSARRDRYGAAESREGYLAENFASQLDRLLKLEVIPYTTLFTCRDFTSTKLNSQIIGSFQLYIPNTRTLYEYLEGNDLFSTNIPSLKNRLNTEQNRNLNFINFESIVLIDIAVGDNDRHFKNLLVQEIDEQKVDEKVSGKVRKLIAIDNANSFPWTTTSKFPSYKRIPLHQYKWRTLPQAQKRFSPKMCDLIKRLDIETIISAMYKNLVHKSAPSSLEHITGKEYTLRLRIRKIQELAERATMCEIAEALL